MDFSHDFPGRLDRAFCWLTEEDSKACVRSMKHFVAMAKWLVCVLEPDIIRADSDRARVRLGSVWMGREVE